jgi:hypothetical protein
MKNRPETSSRCDWRFLYTDKDSVSSYQCRTCNKEAFLYKNYNIIDEEGRTQACASADCEDEPYATNRRLHHIKSHIAALKSEIRYSERVFKELGGTQEELNESLSG